ncbi:hypothetical protein NB559_09950 [Vibrio parahaemolyticus]|uniref:hypothetical protein n=1 Tax=Vibrio parahaemolyticus TaxID=670 RepID=UPI00215BEE10|nr:hypothetical protein [Vibrio parahaemolyticus]MCR9650174.1 hypothetical protein [Vibrio parahaemolyticus]
MLRNKVQRDIISSLSWSSDFTLDDFNVSFYPDSKGLAADIYFKHEPEYFFKIIFNERYEYETSTSSSAFDLIRGKTKTTDRISSKYDLEVSPGKDKFQETWTVMSTKGISERVGEWLKYLEEELTTDAFKEDKKEEKQRVRDTIANHLQGYVDDKDSRFNQEEIVDISAKMEQLVESISETKSLLENEIADLKKVVENINKNLKMYKKGTWYETTLNKLSQWVSGVENVEKLVNTIIKIGERLS